MRPGDRATEAAGTDWPRVKSNRSSDYEGIDIYDWFAHNFVYESNLKEKEKKQ